MKLRLQEILTMSLALGLSDCAFKGAENAPTPVPARAEVSAQRRPEPKSSLMEATVIPKNLPNAYSVRLTWSPRHDSARSTLLRREDSYGQVQNFEVPGTETHEYVDSTVNGGESYLYRRIGLLDAGPVELESNFIEIPRDLELSGEQKTANLVGIGRLFLRQGTVLRTDGGDFKIEADEIISENGLIESFPMNQRASDGRPGRGGGTIEIKVRKVVGVLRVEGRGEAGGQGSDGVPQFGEKMLRDCPKSAATNGPRGGDGASGGNGSQISVEITEAVQDSQIQAQSLPGRGGNPGNPGDHFEGSMLSVHFCSKGAQGRNGIDGKALPVCLRSKDRSPWGACP